MIDGVVDREKAGGLSLGGSFRFFSLEMKRSENVNFKVPDDH